MDIVQDPGPIRRPVARYHGGKFGPNGGVARWINRHLPPHQTYVEPFGGAASVLLCKPRAHAEVYNDRLGCIVNVFRVLRDPVQAAQLREQIALTPFARDEFDATYDGVPDDPVEWARRTVFRAFAGFGSAAISCDGTAAGQTGFRANSNRSGTTPAQDWAHYPDQIPAFVERLRGIVIENRDALQVMAAHDGPTTLHYVDPPYVSTTRGTDALRKSYTFEMTEDDHIALLDQLRTLRGAVVLSGYNNPLYRERLADWHCVSRRSYADGARPREELMWLNPRAVETCSNRQYEMFAQVDRRRNDDE